MRKKNCLGVNQHQHHHQIIKFRNEKLSNMNNNNTHHDHVMIQQLLLLLHDPLLMTIMYINIHHHHQDLIHDKSIILTLLNILITWTWYEHDPTTTTTITDQLPLQRDNHPQFYLIIPFFLLRHDTYDYYYLFTPAFSPSETYESQTPFFVIIKWNLCISASVNKISSLPKVLLVGIYYMGQPIRGKDV